MGIIKPPWGRIKAQARDGASDTVLVLVAMFLGNVNARAGFIVQRTSVSAGVGGGGGGGQLLAVPVSSS